MLHSRASAIPASATAGIPVRPRRPWYEVLGVAPDAPREVIEAAGKATQRKTHPDDANVVELEPALFNKGQWLEVQLVTDGALSGPLVHAQVADGEVVQIVTKDDSAELMKSSTSVIVMTAVIIVASNFLLGQPAPSTILSWAIWVLGLLTFAGYIVFIALTIRRSRRGKYRWVDSTESLASALRTRLAKKG
jgi:hypothetical protein